MQLKDWICLFFMAFGVIGFWVALIESIFTLVWIYWRLGDWGPGDLAKSRGFLRRIIYGAICAILVPILVVWILGWNDHLTFYQRWNSMFTTLTSDQVVIWPLWFGVVFGSVCGSYFGQALTFRCCKKFRRVPLFRIMN